MRNPIRMSLNSIVGHTHSIGIFGPVSSFNTVTQLKKDLVDWIIQVECHTNAFERHLVNKLSPASILTLVGNYVALVTLAPRSTTIHD